MKPPRLSLVYVIVCVFVSIVLIMGYIFVGGDELIKVSLYPLIMILAAMIIGTTYFFEGKLKFTEFDEVPTQEQPTPTPSFPVEQPKADVGQELKNKIINFINQGFQLESIIPTLQKSGYHNDLIQSVLQELVKQGVIIVPKKEPEEELDVPPTPPPPEEKDVKKTLKELEKKADKKKEHKCPKCDKICENEEKLKRHYGMAHYKDLDV